MDDLSRLPIKVSININIEERKNIFNLLKNGVIITDQHSNIIYVNPAFSIITGYSKEEVIGKNPGMMHSGIHNKAFYKKMWQDITANDFWEGEIWNRRKSGQVFPELLTITKVYLERPHSFVYVAIFSDISFLRTAEDKTLHLAFYDPLTELPNRNLFHDHIKEALTGRIVLENKQMAIFYMDLDKFKQVNDAFGHCVGDDLLRLVGARLKSIVRGNDMIARIGGDEFSAIITTNCHKDYLFNLAKRIVETISKPFMVDKHKINISISIGISYYHRDEDDFETALNQADKAMYRAKTQGTQIEFYDATLLKN